MPIRGSPNGAHHPRPQAGRDRPEWVVAINRNRWSQSIGISGRNQPVRATATEQIDEGVIGQLRAPWLLTFTSSLAIPGGSTS